MPISALLTLLSDLPGNVSIITKIIQYMHHIINDQADGSVGKE
jgi:hypothetical protein